MSSNEIDGTSKRNNHVTQNKRNKNSSTPIKSDQSKCYDPYLEEDEVNAGLENGLLFQGVLRINPKNYKESFISSPDGTDDIFIDGVLNRNRALNGDVVVCVLLPPEISSLNNTSITKNTLKETFNEHYETPSKDSKQNTASMTKKEKNQKFKPGSKSVQHETPQKNLKPTPCKTPKYEKKLQTIASTKISEITPTDGGNEIESTDSVDHIAKSSIDNPAIPINDNLASSNHASAELEFPKVSKKTRRKPRKKTPATSITEDGLSQLKENQVTVKTDGSSEPAGLVETPPSATKRKTRRSSKSKPKSTEAGLALRFEKSCSMKQTAEVTSGDSVKIETSSEVSLTIVHSNATAENELAVETQVTSRKTAKVVFIKEFRHSRRAIGCLRPWPFGQNSAVPKWAFFVPRDHRIPRLKIPFTPEIAECLSQPPNMLYLAQINSWDDVNYPQGSLCCLVGNSGNLEAETLALLLEHEVDYTSFSEFILQDLPQLPWSIPSDEITRRRDFRKNCIFTIDPSDARDLDDAVCGRFMGLAADGVTRLFNVSVHIADVSYFVREGTPLDVIASRRATSNYLVDRVIPMLPSVLCEHVCSLNPGEDRLAFSVEWVVNDRGEILEEWFGRSIIRSCVKLSYDHAQAVIEGRDDSEINWPQLKGSHTLADVRQSIMVLQDLASILRKKRVDQGALRIDLPRLAFSMDWETRTPVGFRVYEMKDSNRLIEEFMLLANMRVAEKIYKSFPQIAVLRSHPPPMMNKLEQLADTLQAVGIHIDVSTSSKLQESLVRYGQTSSDPISLGRNLVLNNLVAKPMKNAMYICTGLVQNELCLRHYALSVPFYTHFTSPIRRYPDILVHRLLNAAIEKEKMDHWNQDYVKKILDNCNSRKLAAKALQDSHAELHLANLVRKCGFIEVKGIVLNVLDHSVDVVLVYLGIVRRLYLEKLPLKQLQHEKYHGIGKLSLEWEPEVSGAEPIHQVISIFSLLEIQLVPHLENDKLEFNLVLMRPSNVP